MRWYQIIIMATGLAFLAPQMAMAQPAPKPGVMQPAPVAKKAPKKHSSKKKDERDDKVPPKVVVPPAPHVKPVPPQAKPVHPMSDPHVQPIMGIPVAHGKPMPPPPPHHPEKDGMEPGAFNHLLLSMDRAAFKKDKLEIVRRASGNNWFTCRQVRTLMDRMRLDNDRVEIASALRARIVDPQHMSLIHDGFQHSKSRDRFEKHHHHHH